jgi:xanthine dehydrogenase accessory factor
VNDLREIIKAYDAVKLDEMRGRLATLVKVKGSAFRRPGARMLIRDDGTSVGALSSGCLEADVIERALKLMGSHDSVTVTYDTSSPENEIWGLNLGCNGVIQILLEPLPPSVRSPHLSFLSGRLSSGMPGVIATIFRVDGEIKATVGCHLFLEENGKITEDIKHPPLAAVLTEDCIQAFRLKASCNKEYRFTEGVVDALIEYIKPPLSLFVFGAGGEAVPLVRIAKELGWTVTVVDHRPAFLTKERFPAADDIVLVRPEEVARTVALKGDAAAVILTHDLTHDGELLRFLLPSAASYVGMLGPSSRADLLLGKLKDTGFVPTRQQLSRMHAPIGLNIGSETAEEVALSILSEIQAFFNGRSGGFLRDFAGPIHG